ncbi:MAG: CHASE2 domain-containing protein, partial [Candidatus Omnitrophota bacterium]
MKRWQRIFLIVFFSGFIFLGGISWTGTQASLEGKFFDLFLRFKPKLRAPQEIILVEVDEEVKEDGLWPWKEAWLIYLINYLSGLGVKAIWIDPLLEKYILPGHSLLKSAQTRAPVFYAHKDSPEIQDKDLIFDRDGKIRRYRLFSHEGENSLRQTFLAYKGKGEEKLPEEFLINYQKWSYGEIEKYTYFDLVISVFLSFHRENPRIDFSRFRDKICILALSPTLQNKFYPTPFRSVSPLEIRLQAFNNLLRGNFLHKLRNRENVGT